MRERQWSGDQAQIQTHVTVVTVTYVTLVMLQTHVTLVTVTHKLYNWLF